MNWRTRPNLQNKFMPTTSTVTNGATDALSTRLGKFCHACIGINATGDLSVKDSIHAAPNGHGT